MKNKGASILPVTELAPAWMMPSHVHVEADIVLPESETTQCSTLVPSGRSLTPQVRVKLLGIFLLLGRLRVLRLCLLTEVLS